MYIIKVAYCVLLEKFIIKVKISVVKNTDVVQIF